RLGRSLSLNNVAPTLAGNINEVGLFQLLDKIGEAVGAIRFFGEGGIELEHGRFQQSELRLNRAALQHLEGALDQRHGLHQIECVRTGAMAPLASLLSLTLCVRLSGWAR